VAGGFVLLPGLGVERSLALLALVYAAAAALVPRSAAARARVAALGALALLVLSLVAFPFGLMTRRYLSVVAQRFAAHGGRAIGVREGLTETLIYMRQDPPFSPPVFRLVTNGFSMSGTGLGNERYMSLYAWWPAAVHPRLREALLISYGCGTTARALVQVPGIERVDVVDTSRDILDASRIVHPPGANPLDDPRVRAHVEDGRQYLLTTERRYDLITGEPPPPRLAGVVNLYTSEYFHLMRARLAPGGIVTYWLPVDQLMLADTRAVVGAFCDAFPDCSLWNGSGLNWMLVGTNGRSVPATEGHFAGLWDDPVVGGGLRRIGIERPEQLGALLIDDAPGLRERVGATPPLTDDFPYRILTPVGSTSVATEVIPAYLRWMDADQARRRFAASRFVADVWPPAVRAGSLAYFEWLGLLNGMMIAQTAWQPPSTTGLAEVDAVLTRSSLRTSHCGCLARTSTSSMPSERSPPGARGTRSCSGSGRWPPASTAAPPRALGGRGAWPIGSARPTRSRWRAAGAKRKRSRAATTGPARGSGRGCEFDSGLSGGRSGLGALGSRPGGRPCPARRRVHRLQCRPS
jgi:hypothetical protein